MPTVDLSLDPAPAHLRCEQHTDSLPAALASFAERFGPCTALLSSPTTYRVGSLRADGKVVDRHSTEVDLATVFEARVFSGDAAAELRWVATPDTGRAAVVELTTDDGPDTTTVAGTIVGGGYLLWGTVQASAEGWSTLHSPRTGPIDIPFEARPGASVRLGCLELVGRDPHGNAEVIDELLTGWEVA